MAQTQLIVACVLHCAQDKRQGSQVINPTIQARAIFLGRSEEQELGLHHYLPSPLFLCPHHMACDNTGGSIPYFRYLIIYSPVASCSPSPPPTSPPTNPRFHGCYGESTIIFILVPSCSFHIHLVPTTLFLSLLSQLSSAAVTAWDDGKCNCRQVRFLFLAHDILLLLLSII